MASNDKRSIKEKEALAQELFLETDKSQDEIASIVQVSPKTIGAWKKKGDWELLKQASTITVKNIITNLYQKAYDLSTADKVDADKLVKLANTIEKLQNKKLTISHIINVFQEFTTWAFSENPELAKQINLLQKKFIDHKITRE